MAFLKANFFSPALIRNVDVDIIIPADPMFSFGPPVTEFKALYLLHGFMGCGNDWHLNTDIVSLAQMLNMAVIMPNGENSFYLDQDSLASRYSKFIGEDLVGFTRRLLPLSQKREDTLIAGLSMGGYGALYNGLKYYKTFGHVIALSSAIVLYEAKSMGEGVNYLGVNKEYFNTVFGGVNNLENTDKNLDLLAEQVQQSAKAENLPLDVYFACGYNDHLCHPNRDFHRHLNKIGLEHLYEEGAGTHEWAFWQAYLRRGLDRIYPIPKIDSSRMPFWHEKPAEPID
jgi:S-formylglutathione hydrolase FrmB